MKKQLLSPAGLAPLLRSRNKTPASSPPPPETLIMMNGRWRRGAGTLPHSTLFQLSKWHPTWPWKRKGVSLVYNWQTLQGREKPCKKNRPDCEHGPALTKLTKKATVQDAEPRLHSLTVQKTNSNIMIINLRSPSLRRLFLHARTSWLFAASWLPEKWEQ